MARGKNKSYLATLPGRLFWGALLGGGGFYGVWLATDGDARKGALFAAFMAAICLLPGKRGRYREDAPDSDGGDGGGD